jgi:hypothetical protein
MEWMKEKQRDKKINVNKFGSKIHKKAELN